MATTAKTAKKEIKTNVKRTVKKINKQAIQFSDKMVDETIVTGAHWQAIFEKAIKKSGVLLDKQQDIVFDALEEMKGQFEKGNYRFRKLVNFDFSKKRVNKIVKKVKTAAEAIPAVDRVEKIAENLVKTTTETMQDAMEVVEEKFDSIKDSYTKVAKKTTKGTKAKKATKAPKTAKTTKTVAKKTASKAKTAAKKVVVKAASTKDKLTIIEGIGPKIEGLLNEAGIITFNDLAKSKTTELKSILMAAGKRYQMHDPSTWAAQAKLAAAGKMDELKKMQSNLKGGRKS